MSTTPSSIAMPHNCGQVFSVKDNMEQYFVFIAIGTALFVIGLVALHGLSVLGNLTTSIPGVTHAG